MVAASKGTTILIGVVLAALIGQQGCASKRLPISETLLAEIPTIGLVLRPTDSAVELQIPGKGRLANAGRGAVAGSWIGAYGIYSYYGFIFCVPALATAGALGGAMYGAVVAEPASEWEQAESAFKVILSDLNVQQQVSNHLVESTRSQTLYRVIRVENQDPSSKDEKAPYHALASKGIDAVLEVTELAVHLRPSYTGLMAVNPLRTLVMTTRARLIRTSDGALLDDRVLTDHDLSAADLSASRTLTTWADQNAQVFREEVTQAAQRLAEQVAKDLFSNTLSPNDVPPAALQSVSR